MAASKDKAAISLLLCRANSRLCGLPVEAVIETMRPLPIAALPEMPEFVLGISTIRGKPVPVVDVGRLLGAAQGSDATRFVTIRTGARQTALAFDSVDGIYTIARQSLSALPPLLRGMRDGVVEHIASLDSDLLLVLRSVNIIQEPIWSSLVVQGAQER